MSSTNDMPATITRPHRNGKYGTISFPYTNIRTAQASIDSVKNTPPPRNTIVVCDERSLGLSMMLHLSAILKYSNSAASSSTAIIMYVQTILCIYSFIRLLSPLQAHWGVAPKSLPLPTKTVQPRCCSTVFLSLPAR